MVGRKWQERQKIQRMKTQNKRETKANSNEVMVGGGGGIKGKTPPPKKIRKDQNKRTEPHTLNETYVYVFVTPSIL